MEGIVLVAYDKGMAAHFTRLLQRGLLLREYRIHCHYEGISQGIQKIDQVKKAMGENKLVQLSRMKFPDPMGSLDDIDIEADIPHEWIRKEKLF